MKNKNNNLKKIIIFIAVFLAVMFFLVALVIHMEKIDSSKNVDSSSHSSEARYIPQSQWTMMVE